MIVYITLRNGNIDVVFSSLAAAEHHVRNRTKKWSLMSIVEKEVHTL